MIGAKARFNGRKRGIRREGLHAVWISASAVARGRPRRPGVWSRTSVDRENADRDRTHELLRQLDANGLHMTAALRSGAEERIEDAASEW